ncbi:MAG: class I SAM-dependent methyltransferase [Nocardioides sp.]|nr:class I SAM-dependent methyltransferase [Nocardioides sp.]
MQDIFSEKLATWREYTDSPWARIRYAVVEETIRREAETLGGPLRVLDVGGGDGVDALPLAVAGHDVTVLDQSEQWLDEARRRADILGVPLTGLNANLDDLHELGEFDLVLCHFVLQYRSSGMADLRALAGVLRMGGTISVILPNPSGMVLRQLVVDGPAAARTELAAESKRAVLFDHDARKVPMEEMEAQLSDCGLPVIRRYGTRIANDLITDNNVKHDARFFDDLLRLELDLCDREPFLRMGGLYQLIGQKTAG